MRITIDLHPEVVQEVREYMRQVRQHRAQSRTPRYLNPGINESEAARNLVELGLRWVGEHGIEEAERIPVPRGFLPLIVRDDAP